MLLPAMPDCQYWLLPIGLQPHTRQRCMDAWAGMAQLHPQPGGSCMTEHGRASARAPGRKPRQPGT